MEWKDKTVLITGASRGIGAALAKHIGALGAHLILVARRPEGLEEIDDAVGGGATLVPLDLKEGDSIDALGAELYKRFGKLDALIGNAAILGDITPLHHLRPKVWDDVMTTNVTANYRLIRSMDPLLRSAPKANAIFITSGITEGPASAYWGAYATSKMALEHMVATYAAELNGSNIHAATVSPGVVRTHMRAQAFPGEDPETLPPPEAAIPRILDAMVW